MANKKKLLLKTLAALETGHPHHAAEIPEAAITEKADGHFRIETVHPATEENKAERGNPNLPDDTHISEYLVMTDEEAEEAGHRPINPNPAIAKINADTDFGAVKTPDAAYKVYRIV